METLNLNAKASQTAFARLVGVSQQAISKQIEKGNLSEGATFGEWLTEYCDQLRDQAAGRGGEGQVDVAQATYEEKKTKTALMRLDYHEKLENTINKEEAYSFLADWSMYSLRQFRQSFERLRDDMNNQLEIELPPEMVEKHAGAAIERVRDYALKLGGSDGESGGAVQPAEET